MSVEPYGFLKEHADTEEDVRIIERIEEMRRSIMRGQSVDPGEHDLVLRFYGLTIHLAADLAPSSIDTLMEVFRDGAHMHAPGFSGAGGGAGYCAEVWGGAGDCAGAWGRARDCAGAGGEAGDMVGNGPGTLTVVDLGANEGFYSLAMLRNSPGANIISAEPHPRVFELLRRNALENGGGSRAGSGCRAAGGSRVGSGITPVRTAVTEVSGEIELQSYPHLSTMSSRDIMALGQRWMSGGRLERERVPSTTLPRLLHQFDISRVDILKIDVEGDEAAVLEGALEEGADAEGAAREAPHIDGELCGRPAGCLERIDRIVIEWHSEELRRRCTSLLDAHGFELVHVDEHRFGDLYFVRR